VFGSRVAVATALAVASVICCAACGAEILPPAPSSLLFGGTDLWRYGAFLYGGAVWAPQGLDAGGFAMKALLSGGRYSYMAGDIHAQVDGITVSAAAMPGWRVVRPDFTVSLYAGPLMQDYRLSPYDPGSRLHGLHGGGQLASEIWYQPAPSIMTAFSGSIASIGETGSLRGAVGLRAFDAVFFGPEAAALFCGDFQELQFGAHATAFKFGTTEWSGGAGWALASDRRGGPYLRVGLSARY